ncbi:MAG TPA: nitroreductase [Dehalococcoidia bacterium]|nr:nitroreductase [Chloroflexota bacterium]HCE77098.1 nitroreductase [Dehalococcoidia bacterium]|tara:strand:- start:3446 stop:4015 length:570 start_codon:yes stop_codon:yes gene_type:complete
MNTDGSLIDTIKNRRNTKRFQLKDVNRSDIEMLLESAIWAPNHRNTEPWRFYVVEKGSSLRVEIAKEMIDLREEKSEKKLDDRQKKSIYDQMSEAPCLIFVFSLLSENEEIAEENYAATCCAIQNIQLTATSLGLGVGWSTGNVAKIRNMNQILGTDEDLKIAGVLTVGYPEALVPKTRKDYETVTKWL